MNEKWYSPLAEIASLGSQHGGVTSLAGLHEARGEHLSQFFTPANVASFMWRIATPAMDRAIAASRGDRVALLDSSIGSARLFQFADPAKHSLAGFDVHEPSITAVTAAANAAGFAADFIVASLEEVSPRGYGVALINPPFSIHLENPNMEPFPCCSFGKFGPGSSCMSHVYAVAQALEAAEIVVALLPSSFADTLASDPLFAPRLRLIARLPADAFLAEGANVSTSVAVWDSFETDAEITRINIEDLAAAAIPDLVLSCRTEYATLPRALVRGDVDRSKPSIITAVTGDRTVKVVRHNRRVILKFACGLTEAKVRNAVLRERVAGDAEHRYPGGVTFAGQGALDLQIHLAQPDPVDSFAE